MYLLEFDIGSSTIKACLIEATTGAVVATNPRTVVMRMGSSATITEAWRATGVLCYRHLGLEGRPDQLSGPSRPFITRQ